MKSIICPKCGKHLINLSTSDAEISNFWCDDCNLEIEVAPNTELPVTINDDKLMVEWVDLGEGISGDYNPEKPGDVEFLRFDVSYNTAKQGDAPYWDEVEDASYCTNTPADTNPEILIRLLYFVFKEYRSVIDAYPGSSVKKLGEGLSHISPAYIKKKRRYFIDMDGVLAAYNFNLKSFDELYEEGYFFTRPPHQNIVDAVQYLINEGSGVYILSAVLKDSEFALAEKHEWLDKFMRVPCKQRIFTICGEDKISFVPAFNPSTDVLIDDYGENAKVWSTHGGTYIKVSRDADDASYESSKHQHVIHPELSVSEIIRKIKEV